jgi:hypothetical protein
VNRRRCSTLQSELDDGAVSKLGYERCKYFALKGL